MATPPRTAARTPPRAAVALPALRGGPPCAAPRCQRSAWFAIHHVPVCSSACAARVGSVDATPTFGPVVRAVRWTPDQGPAWTLVVAASRGRHDQWHAWWWQDRRRGGVGHTMRPRRVRDDILTDAGLFALLRRLVRAHPELRAWRIAGWAWEAGTAPPPWSDIALPQHPVTFARKVVRAADASVRRRERVRALRARYRQRGVSQDGTADQAARVA